MEVSLTIVFELISRLGKKVRLTEVQQVHITSRHKELRGQTMKIKAALEEPDFIWYSLKEENHHFYKWFDVTPVTRKYLLLVVSFLNDEGFIVTAFFVSRIRRKDKVLLYGKEDTNSL